MRGNCGLHIGAQVLSVLLTAYLCSDATPTSPTPSTSSDSCPNEFVLVSTVREKQVTEPTYKCYRFFNQKYTFENALKKCAEVDSTLAAPKFEADAESLASYILKNRRQVRRYWIGLSDQEEEGVFKWQDDGHALSANFTSWMITEPESNVNAQPGSRGDAQDCVKMAIWVYGKKKSARFYDTHCEKLEAFVCEHDPIKVPNSPQNTEGDVEGSTASTSLALDSSENEIEEGKEVDFILPKDYKNMTKNEASKSEENKQHFPIEVIAYGESEEIDVATKDDRKTKLHATSQIRPEMSDHPEKQENIIEPEVRIKSRKNSALNKTASTRRIAERRTCSLECAPNFMRAACPLKYFPQMQGTRVVLNNATCRPRRNRTHLIVHTKLDNCGTTVQNVPKINKVSFRNTIHLIPRGSGIVRNRQMALALTEFMILDCRYPQQHSVTHNFNPGEGKPKVYKTIEDGPTLSHIILLYKSSKYDCPYATEEYPVQIPLSRRVYLEVTLDMPSERVELHPVTCFATPDANPYNSNNYVMMQDGCIEDNTFRIEDSESSKVSRFSVEAFRFVGYFRKVYIHCDFIVCSIGSESSANCPYACNPEERYRRSAEDENDDNQNRITSHSGMIDIVDDTEETSDKENNEIMATKTRQTTTTNSAKQKVEPQALSQEEESDPDDDGGNSGIRVRWSVLLATSTYIFSKVVLNYFEV